MQIAQYAAVIREVGLTRVDLECIEPGDVNALNPLLPNFESPASRALCSGVLINLGLALGLPRFKVIISLLSIKARSLFGNRSKNPLLVETVLREENRRRPSQIPAKARKRMATHSNACILHGTLEAAEEDEP